MKPHSLRDWGHLHARLRHGGVILEETQQRRLYPNASRNSRCDTSGSQRPMPGCGSTWIPSFRTTCFASLILLVLARCTLTGTSWCRQHCLLSLIKRHKGALGGLDPGDHHRVDLPAPFLLWFWYTFTRLLRQRDLGTFRFRLSVHMWGRTFVHLLAKSMLPFFCVSMDSSHIASLACASVRVLPCGLALGTGRICRTHHEFTRLSQRSGFM